MTPAKTAARPATASALSIAMTGSGGAGVMTAGSMLLEAAALAGCYGFMSRSSGPQIRGGEAAALLRLAAAPIESLDDRFDLLISVDWLNLERFAAELPLDRNSLIIGDPSQGEPPAVMLATGARLLPLPMKELAKKIPGGRANMVALGYVAGLIGLPEDATAQAVRRVLGTASDRVAASLASLAVGRQKAADVESPIALALSRAQRRSLAAHRQ